MKESKVDVMIVEDNPGDAFMIKEMLQDVDKGLKIISVEDGKKALDTMLGKKGRTPDLVILDLNMPRMNGFEVLSCMKTTSTLSSIPVVVMTGSLSVEDEVRAKSMGASGYCVKPSSFEELYTATDRLRKQLEAVLLRKRIKNDAGPSVNENMDHFIDGARTYQVLSQCGNYHIMDPRENEP